MFKCASCGKQTEPKAKQFKLITATREVIYQNGGHGSEIVTEVGVCIDCKPKEAVSETDHRSEAGRRAVVPSRDRTLGNHARVAPRDLVD